MKLVLQRVTRASVCVDKKVVGSIEKGYVVLLGVSETDREFHAEKLVDKIAKLRIFEDENGKTNLSIHDIHGELLVISQFTLYADCKKGNRPSFAGAGNPQLAKHLYEYFIDLCKPKFNKVASGVFGAEMSVELVNDGPFTLVLESE